MTKLSREFACPKERAECRMVSGLTTVQYDPSQRPTAQMIFRKENGGAYVDQYRD